MVAARRFYLTPVPHASAWPLRDAVARLRIWESQCEDLAYPEGDPRRMMHASEQPQDWHDARRELQEAVTFHAARLGGETDKAADAFADTPEGDHPYNVERARLAESLVWNLTPIRGGRYAY